MQQALRAYCIGSADVHPLAGRRCAQSIKRLNRTSLMKINFQRRAGYPQNRYPLQRGRENMKKEEYVTAISFLTISLQFFSLVQNSLQEIILSKNEWIVVSDDEATIEEYEKKTAWSDHQVIIPVLFNFYHGLELFLKGLMQFDNSF
ncbi:MAG: hypothetical protein Q9O24_10765 [Gammaproteobacteria bacterium]|nr:hypothetical protein [Gammaproteobacteria bacterium]